LLQRSTSWIIIQKEHCLYETTGINMLNLEHSLTVLIHCSSSVFICLENDFSMKNCSKTTTKTKSSEKNLTEWMITIQPLQTKNLVPLCYKWMITIQTLQNCSLNLDKQFHSPLLLNSRLIEIVATMMFQFAIWFLI
jgi:hypothetical protein